MFSSILTEGWFTLEVACTKRRFTSNAKTTLSYNADTILEKEINYPKVRCWFWSAVKQMSGFSTDWNSIEVFRDGLGITVGSPRMHRKANLKHSQINRWCETTVELFKNKRETDVNKAFGSDWYPIMLLLKVRCLNIVRSSQPLEFYLMNWLDILKFDFTTNLI